MISVGACSIHAVNKLVDLLHTIAPVSTLWLSIAMALEDIATPRGGQLEGPKEVGDCLEVGTRGVQLMNHVLNAVDAILTKLFRDDLIVRQRNAVLVHLAK